MGKTKTYIYLLVDPVSKEVRYVGKANNPQRRYAQHIGAHELQKQSHKANWIKRLQADGQNPELHIYAECTLEEWSEAEKETIRLYQSLGARLTNGDEGGKGATQGRIGVKLGRQKEITRLKRGLIGCYRFFRDMGDEVRASRIRLKIEYIQLTRPHVWAPGSVRW